MCFYGKADYTMSVRVGQTISLMPALAGNLLLAWLFWSARGSGDLSVRIIDAGFLVLVTEFLAIYAGGITSGKQVEAERSFRGEELSPAPQKWRVLPVLFLVLAAVALAWFIQKPSLAFFFVVSFIAKYFGHRTVQMYPLTVISMVWLLVSLGVLVIPASFLPYTVSFVENTLFEERVLLWGVVYFSMSAVLVCFMFFRSRKTT